jgi:hypothetical protein
MSDDQKILQQRVERAAETALARNEYVRPVDVLIGMRWLQPSVLDEWRQGRLPSLESAVEVHLDRVSSAMQHLRSWALRRGLVPSETAYVTRTRQRQPLRFSVSGEPSVERDYRTHWVSPDLSERKRERLAERQSRPPDLVAIIPIRPWTCTQCGGTGDFLLMEGPGPICLTCADMDHLVLLPAGNATLSRRAKKASRLSLVVVKFARARNRYERQALLLQEAAIEQAERECLADDEARARRRLRAAAEREVQDVGFQGRFAAEIRAMFPGCPPERAEAIARHAGARGSGRVGRSAAGQALDEEAVKLAVVASVRHDDTRYDELLMSGVDRDEARERIRDAVDGVLDAWTSR